MATTRVKKPKPTLSQPQIEFCKLYASGKSPLEAYNESHLNVNKVRASTYLQNPWIWDEVIKELRTSGKEKHLVESYDQCKRETGFTPTKIFFEYCQNPKHYSKKDSDPFYPLKVCCLAYLFFYNLEREYFTNRLRDVIIKDHETVVMLKNKIHSVNSDYQNFVKYLKEKHISLSNILL